MNQVTKQSEIEKFLSRYLVFSKTHYEMRLDQFKSSFNQVKSAIKSIKKISSEYEKKYGLNFNIFNILGIGHKEVKTHSALLVNLLNPEGSHGQGNIFLKSFLEYLRENLGCQLLAQIDAKAINSDEWKIEKEKVTFDGNLDIVLTESKQGLAIVIENKIYAGDQPDQLKRYLSWIKKSSYKNGVLIYLTIPGRWSKEKALLTTDYYCLSYKEDIKDWLTFAMKHVEATRVRDLLLQYLIVIETL